MIGSIQGRDLEQPGLVKDIPAQGRGVELDDLQKSLPIQSILCFYISVYLLVSQHSLVKIVPLDNIFF